MVSGPPSRPVVRLASNRSTPKCFNYTLLLHSMNILEVILIACAVNVVLNMFVPWLIEFIAEVRRDKSFDNENDH